MIRFLWSIHKTRSFKEFFLSVITIPSLRSNARWFRRWSTFGRLRRFSGTGKRWEYFNPQCAGIIRMGGQLVPDMDAQKTLLCTHIHRFLSKNLLLWSYCSGSAVMDKGKKERDNGGYFSKHRRINGRLLVFAGVVKFRVDFSGGQHFFRPEL